ncbi:MAG: AraC family transcriptional regulator [Verrucomicrobia bacterium]|nr:AraC family transcriptional regulator [Verrucomicrobiota bacterium]
MLAPIYQDRRRTFHADTCAELAEAARCGRVRLEALARGHYPGKRLPPSALPGVKSVGCWDASQAQSWGLDWHRNEGIELTFLERGGVAFSVDRRQAQLRPDDLTVTRPWQRHRVGDPHVGAGRLHWLIVDVGMRRPHQPWRWPAWIVLTRIDREELTHYLRHNERPVWAATPEIRQCFQRIAAAVGSDREGDQVSRLAALINELLVLVLEMFRRRRVTLDTSLASAERTVALFWSELQRSPEHLAEPWTVAAMARQCGLGVTRFIHHSKQLTNTTPIPHLTRCRLEAAARLLRENRRRSVLEVALATGFSSSQYFATCFRRHFGVPPRNCR